MRMHHVRSGRRSDTGFTLLELMVVVTIISILLLIAIPTFMGARERAQDRRAMTIIHTSLVAARIGEADQGDYAWVTQATLQAEAHSVVITDDVTPARAVQNQVSVATGTTGTGTYVVLASLSPSGKCFALLDLEGVGTQYQVVQPSVSCTAGSFDSTTGWTTAW
jgi:type IV pilus assembly protein PilA